MDILGWVLVILFFLFAYIGLIVPVIPESLFLLSGFAYYHFVMNNTKLPLIFWIISLVLLLFLFFIDIFASGIAVKKYGGSNWSFWGSFFGILIFPFLIGPIGFFIGPLLLVFIIEWFRLQNIEQAGRIALATFVGILGIMLLKFILFTALIIWFFIYVFV